ncbi:hypothetical protein EV182_002598 [Spiromyces aspiralis]|uniref:Uncharacterized protein n=1 Tax=Spiromyces aspiralis TaxID=68401 RepID=A0ACC1HLH4_9FUNG|nr:hypothetical protein EV182_002598 [Spiromyces aspiralis]
MADTLTSSKRRRVGATYGRQRSTGTPLSSPVAPTRTRRLGHSGSELDLATEFDSRRARPLDHSSDSDSGHGSTTSSESCATNATSKKRRTANYTLLNVYGTPLRRPAKRPKPSRAPTGARSRPNLEQTFLDFGQKPLAPLRCPECSMTYQRGQPDDEALHRSYHKVYLLKQHAPLNMTMSGWKDCDQVTQMQLASPSPRSEQEWGRNKQQTVTGVDSPSPFVRITKGHQQSVPAKQAVINSNNKGRSQQILDAKATQVAVAIVATTVQSAKHLKRRAVEILNHINDELGASRLHIDEFESRNCKIYLAVDQQTNAVYGCVLAEPANVAYRVVVSREGGDSGDGDKCDGSAVLGPGQRANIPQVRSLDDTVRIEAESYPVACGISRIWVSPRARRSGIASALLDAVRKSFAYGCQLSKSDIAFTQPTTQGRLLAESYMERPDFFVYIEA